MIELRNGKILHGNCLELMKGMPDNSVDLVFTSPPYNMKAVLVNGEYKKNTSVTDKKEKGGKISKKYEHFDDFMPVDDFYAFHKATIVEMLRISKCIVYNFQIVGGSKEAFFKIIGDFNMEIKDIIIWDKGFGQPAISENVLNSAYELLLVLENDGKRGRTIRSSTFKRGEMQNILRIGRGTKGKDVNEIHSAVFPLELAETIVTNFSNEGDVVLDPFFGSGTTGVACLNTNRRFIGMDQSIDYVNLAAHRIENHRVKSKLPIDLFA